MVISLLMLHHMLRAPHVRLVMMADMRAVMMLIMASENEAEKTSRACRLQSARCNSERQNE